MKIEVKKSWLSALILLALAAAAIVYLAGQFLSMREVEPIYPGPGVTEIKMLSDWYPGLEGTAGDTEVYVLEGEQEGDSMLVLGGTHPNEPSGLVAAVLLIENAQPEAGTLYVIPRTNNSAFTCTDPQEGAPMRFTIAVNKANYTHDMILHTGVFNVSVLSLPGHQPHPPVARPGDLCPRLLRTAAVRLRDPEYQPLLPGAYRWHFHRENELRRDPAH